MARILIVGGGCRGRRLAASLIEEGHAARITTRAEAGRGAIEALGAECWLGTPDRLATLRGALENVTVLSWLLGAAQGTAEELTALYTTRLEFFLTQAIDTTVRGVVYEGPAGAFQSELREHAARSARALLERNAIPAVFLTEAPDAGEPWLAQARAAVHSLLVRA